MLNGIQDFLFLGATTRSLFFLFLLPCLSLASQEELGKAEAVVTWSNDGQPSLRVLDLLSSGDSIASSNFRENTALKNDDAVDGLNLDGEGRLNTRYQRL